MNKIRQLYTNARMSGSPADIAAYTEAVKDVSSSDFLSAAEYIIRSSAGLSHFKPLVEKYGLSIPFANRCETILEESIVKCKERNQDSSSFTEALEYIKDRKKKFSDLYSMYEWYSNDDEDQYLESYYGTTKGKHNRLYPEKMLSFGEEAIPDLILTAYENGTLRKLLECYKQDWTKYDGIFCEWMTRSLKDITTGDLLSPYTENACSTIVDGFKRRRQKEFRESVLIGTDYNPRMSGRERIAFDQLIRFNEFCMLGSDTEDAFKSYREILSLYEDAAEEDSSRESEDESDISEPEESESKEEKLKPVFVLLKAYYRNDDKEDQKQAYNDYEGDVDRIKKDPYPIINKVSRGDNYGHSAISFDTELKKSYEVFPQGLIRGDFDDEWDGTKNIYVSVVFVEPETYQKMLDKCEEMVTNPGSVEYAFSNFIKAYIATPSRIPGHHICSAFVGAIIGMSGYKNLHRHYDRLKPEDLTLLPRSFHVIDVRNIGEYRASIPEIERKVEEIYQRHEEELHEYNNELPRLLLKEEIEKADTFDKLVDSSVRKLMKIPSPDELKRSAMNKSDDGNDHIWESYDDELDRFSIFREAGDDMGLMYDDYAPLGKVLVDFITPLRKLISKFNSSPTTTEVDLEEQIKNFKEKINISPEAREIDIRRIEPAKKRVSTFQRTLDGCLKTYASCKDAMAYGGNLWRGIIRRPKVLTKNIDSEEYNKINSGIRQINRALDWFEKAIIDLSNLASQDMNILNLVDRVYRRQNIYEATDTAKVISSKIKDIDKHLPDTGMASDFIIRNFADPGGVREHPDHSTPTKKSLVPSYLKNAHTVANWGEDDDEEVPADTVVRDDSNEDEFKRPSALKDEENDKDNEDTDDTSAPNTDDLQTSKSEPSKGGNIQNYYYYTYTNSLNKNQGSFNKSVDNSRDSSTHNTDRSQHRLDDHSIDNSRSNHSKVTTNSNVKASQTGSNMINMKPKKKKEDDKEDTSKFHKIESASAMPWDIKHFFEDVGDADDDKPTSDHPIKDTLMDIDRATSKYQQSAKKTVTDVQNVGRAASKPVKRSMMWVKKVISDWKDKDETALKEKISDPHARSTLFSTIKFCIKYNALYAAGLLMNPMFLFLHLRSKYLQHKNKDRLRNEIIHELQTELEVLKEKIKDAEYAGDKKAKYRLIRFKGEVEKKLVRVGGGKDLKKLI